MEEKQMNPLESLALIDNMINQAKNKLADNGFYFMFWGWVTALTSVIHYFLIRFGVEDADIIWAITMPVSMVISFIYGWRQGRVKKVKTHIDVYILYLWGGILLAMFISLFFMKWNGVRHTYFFLMLMYGAGSFVMGGLLNFRPLVWGSFFSFAFAILSVFVKDIDLLLCLSGALLFSHIIPGHLLNARFKSQNV